MPNSAFYRPFRIFSLSKQIVAPKKIKLKEAEAELAVQMGHLNEKRAQLKEVRPGLEYL